jgi:hypothetical protein
VGAAESARKAARRSSRGSRRSARKSARGPGEPHAGLHAVQTRLGRPAHSLAHPGRLCELEEKHCIAMHLCALWGRPPSRPLVQAPPPAGWPASHHRADANAPAQVQSPCGEGDLPRPAPCEASSLVRGIGPGTVRALPYIAFAPPATPVQLAPPTRPPSSTGSSATVVSAPSALQIGSAEQLPTRACRPSCRAGAACATHPASQLHRLLGRHRLRTFRPADRLRRTASRPRLQASMPRRRSSGSARHSSSSPTRATPAVERSWSGTLRPADWLRQTAPALACEPPCPAGSALAPTGPPAQPAVQPPRLRTFPRRSAPPNCCAQDRFVAAMTNFTLHPSPWTQTPPCVLAIVAWTTPPPLSLSQTPPLKLQGRGGGQRPRPR